MHIFTDVSTIMIYIKRYYCQTNDVFIHKSKKERTNVEKVNLHDFLHTRFAKNHKNLKYIQTYIVHTVYS